MSAGIFVSYRRDDSRHAAGRLADDLAQAFGPECIFRDIEGIDPGVDFARALETALAACVVMLVLIGPRWLQVQDPQGRRRLDRPDDWIRQEIASALERDIRVVPILLEGAPLPEADDLPPALRPLVRRQALELSDMRWRGDLQRLVDTLSRVPGLARRDAPVASPVPAPAPAPAPRARRPWLVAGALAAVGLLVVLGLLSEDLPPGGDEPQPASPVAVDPAPVATPAVAVTAAPSAPPDVSGVWRTHTGEVYFFEQQGRDVHFTAAAGGVPMGEGQGRFEGPLLRLSMTMQVDGVVVGNAQCDMQAAPDQRSYTGLCQGPDGSFPAQFFR